MSTIDRRAFVVSQNQSGDAADWTWHAGDETELVLRWSIEPGHGDLKPWRDYLIEKIRPVVDSGADVIHLDESGVPEGHLFVNCESAVEGASPLVLEIKQAYPGVAVACEVAGHHRLYRTARVARVFLRGKSRGPG